VKNWLFSKLERLKRRPPKTHDQLDARAARSSETLSVGLGGDRPIELPEEDRLGYQRFAVRLAHSIRTMAPSDGLVIALHGPWGSGKTSILNLTARELAKAPNAGEASIELVRFNPWWFSGEESLVSAFFREVGASIGDDLGSEVKELFKKVGRRASAVGGLIGTALAFVPGGSPFGDAIKKVSAAVGDEILSNESLDEARESLRTALNKQNERILVVIDDIDRLLPEEGRQIFKLVKSVADLPKVIYLLAFDRRYADRVAAKDEYTTGAEFLEKIVQVPFDIPSPDQTAINGIFFAGLDTILGNIPESFDKTRWGNVFHDGIAPFLKLPRHVTRLLNSIKVAWPSVSEEVDITDFVFLQTLRTFHPELYRAIETHQDRFAGLRDRDENRDANAAFYNELIGQNDEKNDALRNGLMRVFPQVESALTNHGYSHEFLTRWRRERRACSPEHFPTFFRLELSSEALPAAVFHNFLENCGDRQYVAELLVELAKKKETQQSDAEKFLEQIQDYTDDLIPLESIPNIIGALYEVADSLLSSHDLRVGGFGYGIDVSLGRVLWQLMKRIPRDEREKLLVSLAANTTSVSFLVREISVFGQQQGKLSSGDPDPEDQWVVGKDALENLEKTAAGRIASLAKENRLVDLPQLAGTLFRWRDWGGENQVRSWSNGLTVPDDLLKIAKEFTSETSSYSLGMFGLGDRVTTKQPIVYSKSMSELFDLEKIRLMMQRITADSAQPESNRQIAKEFLDGLRNDEKGPHR
jgi:predicted KAP-like P-loop ATPase